MVSKNYIHLANRTLVSSIIVIIFASGVVLAEVRESNASDGMRVEQSLLPIARLDTPETASEGALAMATSRIKLEWQRQDLLRGRQSDLQENFVYTLHKFYYKDPQSAFVTKKNIGEFYELSHQLLLSTSLSEQSTLVITQKLGIFSNYDTSPDWQDFKLEGGAYLNWQVNRFRDYSLGLGYFNLLGEPKLLPIVHYRYIKKNYRIDIKLPDNAGIHYRIKPKHNIGVEANIFGNQYVIHDNTLWERLGYTEMTLSGYYQYKLSKPLSLKFNWGMSLHRELILAGNTGDSTEYEFENKAYFRTVVEYKFGRE